MEGVALLLLWALNKGIFGAKRIPKTYTCSSFKILQTCEDISLSITDLMLAVVCFAGFPEELQKHFVLLHLFAWGLHPTDLSSLSLSFFQFSDLRLVAVCFHLARPSLIVCQDKASHQLLISDKGL